MPSSGMILPRYLTHGWREMVIVYDEIYITTKREIKICRTALKKLRQIILVLEQKYLLTTSEFLEKYQENDIAKNPDFLKWRTAYNGITGWEKRLREYQDILMMNT